MRPGDILSMTVHWKGVDYACQSRYNANNMRLEWYCRCRHVIEPGEGVVCWHCYAFVSGIVRHSMPGWFRNKVCKDSSNADCVSTSPAPSLQHVRKPAGAPEAGALPERFFI